MLSSENLLEYITLHLRLHNILGNIPLFFEKPCEKELYLNSGKLLARHKCKYILYVIFAVLFCYQTLAGASIFPISITLESSLYCVLFIGWLTEKVRFQTRIKQAAELFNLVVAYEVNSPKGNFFQNYSSII